MQDDGVDEQVDDGGGRERLECLVREFAHGPRGCRQFHQADRQCHGAVLDDVQAFAAQGRKGDTERHGQQHVAVRLRQGQPQRLAGHFLAGRQGVDARRKHDGHANRMKEAEADDRRQERGARQRLQPRARILRATARAERRTTGRTGPAAGCCERPLCTHW